MGKTLHLALLNFTNLHDPPLKPVKAPLYGIPPLQHINYTAQQDVLGKLAESVLIPTVHGANKDIE